MSNPAALFSVPLVVHSDSSVSELLRAWQALQQVSASSVLIEEQKLRLLRLVVTQINRRLPLVADVLLPGPTGPMSVLHRMIKYAGYFSLLGFGMLEDLANSYYFGFTLLALLPGVSTIVLVCAALSYAVLDSVFFFWFDSLTLQKALGMQIADSRRLQDVYAQQLHAMTHINRMLSSIPGLTLDNQLYASYMEFSRTATRDLCRQYKQLPVMRESILQQCIKGLVFGFGAVSSIAGSYFMVAEFMALLAPALVGTPVGWLICALFVTMGLIFHYLMQDTGMGRIVSRDQPRYLKLLTDWKRFQNQYADNLEPIFSIKKQFEKKETQEMSTQTDEYVPTSICFGD